MSDCTTPAPLFGIPVRFLGRIPQNRFSHLYLAAPTVVVENVESGINVSWNKISGAKTYAIYRANLEKDGDWSDWGIVATVKNNKLSVTDKTVKNGETYRYIVRAVSDKVKSSYVASSAIVAGENFQEETTQPTESTT